MTNAWIQRFLTLATLVLACAMAVWLWPRYPSLAWACVLIPALASAAPIATQFIALWCVNRSDPSPRASVLAHVGAFVREAIAAVQVFNIWQPFRHHSMADTVAQAAQMPGQRGVILVHGFFCNRAFWTHWMRRLQTQSRPFIALDLEPAFGSISDYAASIDQAVRRMQDATGLPPVLVGHSMGGLALRAWLASAKAHAQQISMAVGSLQPLETKPIALTGAARAHRIITIGTPHHGTWLAQHASTTNGAQMQLNSRWLNALASNEKEEDFSNVVCFYSNCDNIVFPVSSAKLAGADNRLIVGRGHVDMAHAKQVIDACWELMQ